jgi:predicted Zn finger-like uncharacterized protein
MHSQCPNCDTVYRITAEQLKLARGKVRCGQCQIVFDALEKLQQLPEPAAAVVPTEPAPPAEPGFENEFDTASEIDLDSDLNFKPESTTTDAPAVAADCGPIYATSDVLEPLHLVGEDEARDIVKTPVWGKRFWTAMAVIATLLLPVQWHIMHHGTSLDFAPVRAAAALFCNAVPCPSRQDQLADVSVAQREVRRHPNYSNALLMSITLLNEGQLPIPAPIVGVRFTDSNGRLVAYRYFGPTDYLPEESPAEKLIQPQLPLLLVLEVLDPGPNAVSYEFTLK